MILENKIIVWNNLSNFLSMIKYTCILKKFEKYEKMRKNWDFKKLNIKSKT